MKFYFLLPFTMLSFFSKAQDIIVLKDGSEIKAQVLEIQADQIKYKKNDNKSGPTFSMSKTTIFMVKFENGTKEVFKDSEIPTNSLVSIQKSSPANAPKQILTQSG